VVVDGIPFVMHGRIGIHAISIEFMTGFGGYGAGKNWPRSEKVTLKDREDHKDIRNCFPRREAQWASQVLAPKTSSTKVDDNLKSVSEDAQTVKHIEEVIEIGSSTEDAEGENHEKSATDNTSQKQERKKGTKQATRQQPARSKKRSYKEPETEEESEDSAAEGDSHGGERKHIRLDNVHDYCEEVMKK
jgi:hypothetical protein